MAAQGVDAHKLDEYRCCLQLKVNPEAVDEILLSSETEIDTDDDHRDPDWGNTPGFKNSRGFTVSNYLSL